MGTFLGGRNDKTTKTEEEHTPGRTGLDNTLKGTWGLRKSGVRKHDSRGEGRAILSRVQPQCNRTPPPSVFTANWFSLHEQEHQAPIKS